MSFPRPPPLPPPLSPPLLPPPPPPPPRPPPSSCCRCGRGTTLTSPLLRAGSNGLQTEKKRGEVGSLFIYLLSPSLLSSNFSLSLFLSPRSPPLTDPSRKLERRLMPGKERGRGKKSHRVIVLAKKVIPTESVIAEWCRRNASSLAILQENGRGNPSGKWTWRYPPNFLPYLHS